jgi:4-aminobutyrate aminotransferase-like enzyme
MDMSMAEKVVSITKGLPDHLAPVFAQFPLDVRDAQGVYLHTPSGRKVLDLYGGHAVAALGYGHPRWVEALSEQARALCFQSNAVPLDVRRRAATRLAAFCGRGRVSTGVRPRPAQSRGARSRSGSASRARRSTSSSSSRATPFTSTSSSMTRRPR